MRQVSWKSLPNSAFADPKARRYPIIDEHHVIAALQAIMWRIIHHPRPESLPYLKKVHDRILERADELHMDLKHECELCDVKEKVQFT
jgi:hypothetical protein